MTNPMIIKNRNLLFDLLVDYAGVLDCPTCPLCDRCLTPDYEIPNPEDCAAMLMNWLESAEDY